MQATHAVVSVSTDVFQVTIRFDDSGSAWGMYGKGDTTLFLRVGLCSNNLTTIKVFRMHDAIRAWVALLPCESCAESKTNPHIAHVKQSLLQATVPTTSKVPCCLVGGATLLLVSIKDSLDKGPSSFQGHSAAVKDGEGCKLGEGRCWRLFHDCSGQALSARSEDN